jgi:hypothetical protein
MPSRTPTVGYDTNVFINCPFDKDYEPVLFAIVFTVIECGFTARCALEAEDTGPTRIDKIYSLIEDSRFGVHDISRVEHDASHDLPRFNMPFELGIFLGARRFGGRNQSRKRCLVLEAEKYRYQKFLSDIAGQRYSSTRKRPAAGRGRYPQLVGHVATESGKTTPGCCRDHETLRRIRDDFARHSS